VLIRLASVEILLRLLFSIALSVEASCSIDSAKESDLIARHVTSRHELQSESMIEVVRESS
jgi:hypothetical protein